MKFRSARALNAVLTTTMPCAFIFLALAAPGMASTTWDVVTNFNGSNNGSASSVFSYGEGVSPGAFLADGTTTLNCHGTPTLCDIFPSTNAVIWNGTGGTVVVNASTNQPNTVLYIDPAQSAGIIVRFTAPLTDVYSVSGNFSALDSFHHTTNGSVYVNGVLEMGPSALGSFGSTAPISLSGLALNAGQTIDFIVTSASDAGFLATGLSATITETPVTVPEPGTLASLGIGSLALGMLALRQKNGASRFRRP